MSKREVTKFVPVAAHGNYAIIEVVVEETAKQYRYLRTVDATAEKLTCYALDFKCRFNMAYEGGRFHDTREGAYVWMRNRLLKRLDDAKAAVAVREVELDRWIAIG